MIFAVHISDGVLLDATWLGGVAFASLLVAWSGFRVHETEIPRLGVLTAGFFVASQIHLPLGGVSVHLLLNGLLGVILGRRCVVAIAVGLTLQAVLFGHGGITTLGINVVVYALPALVAGWVYPLVHRVGLFRFRGMRGVLVGLAAATWLVAAVLAIQWSLGTLTTAVLLTADASTWWLARPEVTFGIVLMAAAIAILEPRLEKAPEFPLGLLLGAAAAFGAVGLNCLVLAVGGKEEVRGLAGVVLLAHLPVVVVEGMAVGFVVGVLSRAKPEWLAGYRGSGSGNTSSNGISH